MQIRTKQPADDGWRWKETASWASRSRRVTGVFCASVAVAVAVAVVLVACGGGSASPGVANLGSTTTTTAPVAAAQGGNQATNYADGVAYSECMRTHGVPNMPDPNNDGNFLDNRGTVNGVAGIDPNSSAYQKADKACSHLLPNNGKLTAAEQQQATAKAVKLAQCMRSHGITNFPDPTTSGGGVGFVIKGLDPNSPQFQAAQKACHLGSGAGGL